MTLYTTTRLNHRNRPVSTTILPALPDRIDQDRRDIYMSFIQALRSDPHRRMEVRILCAIHASADATQNSDAYVSRVLVDLGLRCPRLALPGDFLDHADAHLLRSRPLPSSIPASYKEIAHHWKALSDDVYAFLPSLQAPEGEPEQVRV